MKGVAQMICAECDRLDKVYIRPRTERTQRRMRGTLTPEIETRLESEEGMARAAIQNHRANDHQPGDTYE
jgi:hypothetical protein